MSYKVIKRVPGIRREKRNQSPDRQAIVQDAAMAVRKARVKELLALLKSEKNTSRARCIFNELMQIRVPIAEYRPTKGYLVRSGKRMVQLRRMPARAA